MLPTEKPLHIGVYAVIFNKTALLLVRKSRGPYKGLFDLPGGRPMHGEPLEEALKREVMEETSVAIMTPSLFKNISFVIPYDGKDFYHIALIYKVTPISLKTYNPTIIHEDVSGSLFIEKMDLDPFTCSPIVKEVLAL